MNNHNMPLYIKIIYNIYVFLLIVFFYLTNNGQSHGVREHGSVIKC